MKGSATMSKTVEANTGAVAIKYGSSNSSYKKAVEKLLRILIEKKMK